MILFENYRGFDISDRVEAVQVTPDNIQILCELTGGRILEEPDNGIPVALQMPDLWNMDADRQVAVKLWDFLVKGAGDSYLYYPNESFKKTFAKAV
jgi:hypothetical protein